MQGSTTDPGILAKMLSRASGVEPILATSASVSVTVALSLSFDNSSNSTTAVSLDDVMSELPHVTLPLHELQCGDLHQNYDAKTESTVPPLFPYLGKLFRVLLHSC